MGAAAPKSLAKFASCMQLGPYADACLMPVHGVTGCGAFQRDAPTGGAANGMPLNEAMPFATAPATRPPVTSASRTWAPAVLPNSSTIAAHFDATDSLLIHDPPFAQ